MNMHLWKGRQDTNSLQTVGNTVRYREDILLPHVVPILQAHPYMTPQHDNVTSRTVRSVRNFLQEVG